MAGRPGLANEQSSRTRRVALIITLILLLLLSAASLAIVLLVSSDTMINSFYRNYAEGSFYAADSGVNASLWRAMASAISGAGVQTANPPLSVGGTAIPTTPRPGRMCRSRAGNTRRHCQARTHPSRTATTRWAIRARGRVNSRCWPSTVQPRYQSGFGTFMQFGLEPSIGDGNSCLPVTAVTCPSAPRKSTRK